MDISGLVWLNEEKEEEKKEGKAEELWPSHVLAEQEMFWTRVLWCFKQD